MAEALILPVPGRYEPGLQRTYEDFAEHYGTAVIPARPKKPRDKAKVEAAVLVAQRWILARLRNETFFTLDELNGRVRELLVDMNGRRMRRYGASRRELFEKVDRPALRALPATAYTFAIWSMVRVGSDYHVDVDGHAYSVPHGLHGRKVEVRATSTIVEVLQFGHAAGEVVFELFARVPGDPHPVLLARSEERLQVLVQHLVQQVLPSRGRDVRGHPSRVLAELEGVPITGVRDGLGSDVAPATRPQLSAEVEGLGGGAGAGGALAGGPAADCQAEGPPSAGSSRRSGRTRRGTWVSHPARRGGSGRTRRRAGRRGRWRAVGWWSSPCAIIATAFTNAIVRQSLPVWLVRAAELSEEPSG